MESQLFIPSKIKVGFNLRDDTFSKKLGYVIAFDGKKWRKENSWEGWRQKVGEKKKGNEYVDGNWVESKGTYGEEVAPIELDNTPVSGFVLNKKVGGYKSNWNVRQTMIRIWHPANFEFEITPVNLLYILENCNCLRGKGLEGEFVFSWDGKDLILLPCICDEYQKAFDYTSLQSQKIRTKDLVPGFSYKTKKQEDIIYVGKYPWHQWTDHYSYNPQQREKKIYHIFHKEKKEKWKQEWLLKTNLDFLAIKNSDDIIPSYTNIVEKFQKETHSAAIVKWELEPVSINLEESKGNAWSRTLKRMDYYQKTTNGAAEVSIGIVLDYNSLTKDYEMRGYSISERQRINFDDSTKARVADPVRQDWWGTKPATRYQASDLQAMEFFELYVTLENGKRIKAESINYI